MFLHIINTMAILLKTASVRVSSIQIMQVRVQNKDKSVWKSRYDGDVSTTQEDPIEYEQPGLQVFPFQREELAWPAQVQEPSGLLTA